MTREDEQAMHKLAVQLAELTDDSPWEMMRYLSIARVMQELVTYCAVSETPRRQA